MYASGKQNLVDLGGHKEDVIISDNAGLDFLSTKEKSGRGLKTKKRGCKRESVIKRVYRPEDYYSLSVCFSFPDLRQYKSYARCIL